MVRDKQLKVKVSIEELVKIQINAKKNSKSFADYVRDSCISDHQEVRGTPSIQEVEVYSIKFEKITEENKEEYKRQFYKTNFEKIVRELETTHNNEMGVNAYLEWLLDFRCTWGVTFREWLRYQVQYLPKGVLPGVKDVRHTFPCLEKGDIELILTALQYVVYDIKSFDKFMLKIRELSMREIEKYREKNGNK